MFLTGVVITKNSDQTIKKCLTSLQQVADEIIIYDSGSEDATLKIAEAFSCRVIEGEWLGYGATKNFANQFANASYILSVDSDEELSPELISQILIVKKELKGIYSFKRLNNYCGKWIRNGSWYPDIKIRIFPKENHWDDSPSHENLIISKGQKISFLSGVLLHYAYANSAQFLQKTKYYAHLGAIKKSNQHVEINILKMVFSPIFGFLKSYVFKLGLMDGIAGLEIALINSYGTFLKYKTALTLKNR
jgi:glycosyltransferase involved in cell wall biosynthesis